MIRLNFLRKFWLFLINLAGLLVSIGIPLAFVVNAIYSSIEIETVDKPKVAFSFVAAGLMLILMIVYAKWIKKLFDRKLQALAVVNEIGMYSSKPVIWNRLLKTLEYVFPAIVMLIFVRGLRVVFSLYPIFDQLYRINVWFIILLAIGSVIYLVADFVKIAFMNRQKVEDELSSELKKDKLLLKRASKGQEEEIEALRIKRQLQQLQDSQD